MPNINKVVVAGRLGRDPEVRYMPDGSAVCNVSIASSRYWTDKATGEKKESTEWHPVVLYGRHAELVGEYKRKGNKLYVEGFLRTRKWTDQSGQDRYTTEIIAREMQLLGRDDSAPSGNQEPQQQSQQPQRQQNYQAQSMDNMADMDDDIPF